MVEAQSGLSQGSDRGAVAGARNTELGCRHWRLSRAGRNSGSGSDGGDGDSELREEAAALLEEGEM